MNETLLLYTFITIVNCVTPGAGVLFTLSSAFRYGKSSWMMAPIGNTLGVAIMSTIAACGLGTVIRANEWVFSSMQLVGCMVMIWLGLRCWRAPAVDLSNAAHIAKRKTHQSRSVLLSATLLQSSNPMLIVFVLSFLPQFVSPEGSYAEQMAVLIAIFVVVCLVVHLSYSYMAVSACKFLRGARFSFWLNHISASLFWLLSAGMLWNLFEHLREIGAI